MFAISEDRASGLSPSPLMILKQGGVLLSRRVFSGHQPGVPLPKHLGRKENWFDVGSGWPPRREDRGFMGEKGMGVWKEDV